MKRTKEIWVPAQYIREDGTIEVFPKYKVSNTGKVLCLDYRHTKKPDIMTLTPDPDGYLLVRMANSNYRVNRLVMSSFKPNEFFIGAIADHKDSVRSNNVLSNLRWFSKRDNADTPHARETRRKSLTNHPSYSKPVKVTFLDDGHTEIYPSAAEASRTLGLYVMCVTTRINQHNGYYPKRNLHFQYV